MLLSPLATPFQPHFAAPTMDFHDMVQGFEDETLDETFPPSAQEAAELEAVEFFVDMMATFSMMEEQEEKCRKSFCHVQKRWEARRGDGLVGKPRPAKHLVDAVQHTAGGSQAKPVQSTDLIVHSHANHELAAALLHSRRQSREEYRRMNNRADKSRASHQPRPLQQPRKMN